jgi:hypothetical protein
LCEPAFPGGLRPSCAPLQSTIQTIHNTTPTGRPRALCIGHSDNLYETVYGAIIQTERYLDFSSLSAPDGRFMAAFRNAFTYLHSKNKTIEVRHRRVCAGGGLCVCMCVCAYVCVCVCVSMS